MDIKFDAAAASQLIVEMDSYCSGIVKETRDILDVAENSNGWNDKQAKNFQNNMKELAADLNKVLALESEYMRTFYRKVMELRGE